MNHCDFLTYQCHKCPKWDYVGGDCQPPLKITYEEIDLFNKVLAQDSIKIEVTD